MSADVADAMVNQQRELARMEAEIAALKATLTEEFRVSAARAAEIAALKKQLAEVKAKREDLKKQVKNLFRIGIHHQDRADAAEAKLADADGRASELFTNGYRLVEQLQAAEAANKRLRAETSEECATLIEQNMLCSGPGDVEVLSPRTNPGNKVGFAYAAAIRALASETTGERKTMADVKITPKIRCDNCGTTADKLVDTASDPVFGPAKTGKPRTWGTCSMEGSRSADSYGGKNRLDYPDLCPVCADAALEAVQSVLKFRRESGFDGPTGAE